MKKIIITGCLATLSFLAIGQTGPYVSFNTGVAFAAAGDVVGTSRQFTSNSDNSRTNIYGSNGNGINLTLRGGFKPTQNFGAELGVSYLYGLTNTIEENDGTISEEYTKSKSSQLRLMPGIVMATSNKALTIYSRFGIVIPLSTKIKTEEYNKVTSPTTKEILIKREYTGAISIGYYAGAGVSLKINDNLKAFAEIEMINLRVKSKTSIKTEDTENGVDRLASDPIRLKETIYVDEVTSGDNTNNDEPGKELAFKSNFSSLGLNFGIRMNF